MKKKSKSKLELVREYWPLIIFGLTAISSVAVMAYQVKQDSKTLENHNNWLMRHSEQIDDVRIEQAKLQK